MTYFAGGSRRDFPSEVPFALSVSLGLPPSTNKKRKPPTRMNKLSLFLSGRHILLSLSSLLQLHACCKQYYFFFFFFLSSSGLSCQLAHFTAPPTTLSSSSSGWNSFNLPSFAYYSILRRLLQQSLLLLYILALSASNAIAASASATSLPYLLTTCQLRYRCCFMYARTIASLVPLPLRMLLELLLTFYLGLASCSIYFSPSFYFYFFPFFFFG